jgi:hypothetical protein
MAKKQQMEPSLKTSSGTKEREEQKGHYTKLPNIKGPPPLYIGLRAEHDEGFE